MLGMRLEPRRERYQEQRQEMALSVQDCTDGEASTLAAIRALLVILGGKTKPRMASSYEAAMDIYEM